jgi:hypothetical protein
MLTERGAYKQLVVVASWGAMPFEVDVLNKSVIGVAAIKLSFLQRFNEHSVRLLDRPPALQQ